MMGCADDGERGKENKDRMKEKEEEVEGVEEEGAAQTDKEQSWSMSSGLLGGAIPLSNNVITSNGVLMRLHGEDKNKL